VTDPTLVIGWLLVSHLTADFVLQTDASVADRRGSGPQARRALGFHGLVVAACMLPFWLAFGTPGLFAAVVVAAPHPFIDAAKTRLTGLRQPAAGEGDWSPWPAGFFIIDQAAHLALLFAAWWVFLRDAALNPWFVDRVAQATSGIAAADFQRATLVAIVGWSVAVVNVRAARFFVPLLLPPETVGRTATTVATEAATAVQPSIGYRVKLGPLSGRIEPDRRPTVEAPEDAVAEALDNVGAVVGILERLLVVILVLDHAEFAIGLVIAAKTLARFKQLDERRFAEKYLVGTLASVTVAVATALVARAALGI
jgi:hypothetical protein